MIIESYNDKRNKTLAILNTLVDIYLIKFCGLCFLKLPIPRYIEFTGLLFT